MSIFFIQEKREPRISIGSCTRTINDLSWKRSFASAVTLRYVARPNWHRNFVSANDRSKFGFRIVEQRKENRIANQKARIRWMTSSAWRMKTQLRRLTALVSKWNAPKILSCHLAGIEKTPLNWLSVATISAVFWPMRTRTTLVKQL